MSKRTRRRKRYSSDNRLSPDRRSVLRYFSALGLVRTRQPSRVRRGYLYDKRLWELPAIHSRVIYSTPSDRGEKLVRRNVEVPGMHDVYTEVKKGHEHCKVRKSRRQILFSQGVAGFNKRRSPGRGGTYIRTDDSRKGC